MLLLGKIARFLSSIESRTCSLKVSNITNCSPPLWCSALPLVSALASILYCLSVFIKKMFSIILNTRDWMIKYHLLSSSFTLRNKKSHRSMHLDISIQDSYTPPKISEQSKQFMKILNRFLIPVISTTLLLLGVCIVSFLIKASNYSIISFVGRRG